MKTDTPPLPKPMRSSGKKLLVPIAAALAAIILTIALTAYLLWWMPARQSPQRLFGRMLQTSLSTQSYTLQYYATTSQYTTDTIAKVVVAPDVSVEWQTAMSQETSNGKSHVDSQSIVTPKDMYVRYTKIDIAPTQKDKKRTDYSSVENKWAKYTDQGQSGISDALTQGAVPMGKLTAKQRGDVLSKLSSGHAYRFSLKSKKRTNLFHTEYTYKVQVNSEALCQAMSPYYSALKLDNLAKNTDACRGSETADLEMTIDGTTHRLVRVSDDHATRTFSAYNRTKTQQSPAKTISGDELQKMITSLNKANDEPQDQ